MQTSLFFLHKLHIFKIVWNNVCLVLAIYLAIFSLIVASFLVRVSSAVIFLLSEVCPLEFLLVSLFSVATSILHSSDTEMKEIPSPKIYQCGVNQVKMRDQDQVLRALRGEAQCREGGRAARKDSVCEMWSCGGYGCVHGAFISLASWSLDTGWCQMELERLAS